MVSWESDYEDKLAKHLAEESAFLARTQAAWDDVCEHLRVGQGVAGTVVKKEHFGVFVDLGVGFLGLLEVVDMKMPSKGTLGVADYPDVGTELCATILQFKDKERQIRLCTKPLPSPGNSLSFPRGQPEVDESS